MDVEEGATVQSQFFFLQIQKKALLSDLKIFLEDVGEGGAV